MLCLPCVLCAGGACAFLTLELRPATSDYLSQAVPHIAIPNFVEGLGEWRTLVCAGSVWAPSLGVWRARGERDTLVRVEGVCEPEP